MLITVFLFIGLSPFALAERQCLPDGAAAPKAWLTNYPPFRVIGNLYSVGGADLGVYLLTSPDGHILINTGLESSTTDITSNMETLGFKLEDVKILLVMQAHFDHAAALAEIKEISGAELWATEPDAPILEDGGISDPHFGECTDLRFTAIQVDRKLQHSELIELGGMQIKTHLHPGHTEGSSSYSFNHREDGRDYNVVIANMGSINRGKKLLVEPTYPGVADDFETTYKRQLAMSVDIWVAAHASQYRRDSKYQPGQAYSPDTFVDAAGFVAEVKRLRDIYRQQLAIEEQSLMTD
jgi:metallo-beta-lactamase class B